jgi:nitrate reductase gamma subunit
MQILTALYAFGFYLATILLICGLSYKLAQYIRTPEPLKIPLTPAPVDRTGVVLRMAREMLLFESGFRGNKGTWIYGWLLHVGLLLVLIRHLRYFLDPVPSIVVVMQPLGVVGGFAMALGLAGRWTRRLSVDRIRYCSSPADHLILALLLAIVASGLVIRLLIHTDIVAVKTFVIGLYAFDPTPLPTDPLLLLHLGLAAVLIAVFPYSKLVHAVGFYFSPTRTQADNPRELRLLVRTASRHGDQ